jgi:hypothetical protein
VVIHDLNIFCAGFRPAKADAPLIVDTNAVPAGTVAFEWFKAISGRYSQIIQSTGNLELSQLSSRYRRDVHEPSHANAF